LKLQSYFLKECVKWKFHHILSLHNQVTNFFFLQAPATLDGKSFSQYEAVFLQLADEHRTVNAFELQELLDACLPNGKYNKVLAKSRHLYLLK
jgi:hypothetical protein